MWDGVWERFSQENGRWDKRCGICFHGKLEDEVRDVEEVFMG